MAPEQSTCPVCGASLDSEDAPDPLGVHRCRSCKVEFRPSVRVPIRHAGSSRATEPSTKHRAALGLAAAMALILGVAMAAGDSQAPPDRPSFVLEPMEFSAPPTFDPAMLDAIELYDPLGVVELDYEVHASQLGDGELFATGLLRNPDPAALGAVTMEVSCRDSSGAKISTHAVTVACPNMAPSEVCAWAIDVDVPGGVAEFVFEAVATRSLMFGGPDLDLRGRFDADGHPRAAAGGEREPALVFDPEARTLSFRVAEGVSVLGPWATVTTLDGDGRVMDVSQTRWPEMLLGGHAYTRRVTVSAKDDPDSYEVRVGGDSIPQI